MLATMTWLDDDAKRNFGNRRVSEKNRLEPADLSDPAVVAVLLSKSNEFGSFDTDFARFGMRLLSLIRLSAGGTEPRNSGLFI